MAELRPRHYAAQASELSTFEERKQFVENEVPEAMRPLVITHLKIALMRKKHSEKIRKQRLEDYEQKAEERKKKSIHRRSASRGGYGAAGRPFK